MDPVLEGPNLPAVGIVAELSPEDRGILSSYGEFHIAEPDAILIPQGAVHGKLYFILSGVLHAVRHDGDRDVLLGTIHQGDWVGEVELFDPVNALCSVIVRERAQYWIISRKDLEEFMNTYPQPGIQIVVGLAGILCRRLRSVTKKLMDEAQLAVVRASLLGGETR